MQVSAVLDGTGRDRREDDHVLVEGDGIREVSDRPIPSAAAETIDLAARMAGLPKRSRKASSAGRAFFLRAEG